MRGDTSFSGGIRTIGAQQRANGLSHVGNEWGICDCSLPNMVESRSEVYSEKKVDQRNDLWIFFRSNVLKPTLACLSKPKAFKGTCFGKSNGF